MPYVDFSELLYRLKETASYMATQRILMQERNEVQQSKCTRLHSN